jgi:metal-responsive CopG/Arc/MetJ family transcriptional regulator
MKRITVSLPDELVERVKRVTGERQVSSYVAAALAEHLERESLNQILTDWQAETPITQEMRRQAEAELDKAGLAPRAHRHDRMAG